MIPVDPSSPAELANYRYLFEGLIEQSVAGIYLLQNDKLIYVNEAFAKMCGTSRDKLAGKSLADVAPRDQRDELLRQYARRLRGESPENTFIVRIKRPNESTMRAIEIHGRLISYRGEPAVIGVGIDATSRLLRHQELEDSKARLSELLTYIQKVRDEERLDISMELHDAVGGMLSALRFDLIRIGKKIGRLTPLQHSHEAKVQLGELEDTAEQAMQLVQDTIKVVRQISEDLHPSALPHLGIAEAIKNDLEKFESRYGIRGDFHHAGARADFPDETVRDLYRIFQEGLNNVAKHARATRVAVSIRQADQWFVLSMEDDGVGMAGHAPQPGKYGLSTMRERVRRYGGTLDIAPGAQGGVRLTVGIPVAGIPVAGSPVAGQR
ncbi:PAS domain-containing sensor histidine kinase [Parapusillimonas granuli]|uniref:histidine kinase n=1 Tax=Parapusillimonas granuli TaxID=380911 RepID=A0A853FWP0_9BURK|nr:PAS domain-containing sensor histidine kinase [Parapusillimonas granuli]MBB5216602.1 PAS domain S-box-containing protein [Parapusillimonas granuli]NYT48092.1 PAS domain-containing sensor histidine kinase [Parapusillimonas granuli]